MMSLLDAHIPQLVASQSEFAAKAGLMRSTIAQAEQAALSAQAFNAGDGAGAYQSAHARFVEAATQVNALLDVAQANLGDAAGAYVAADAAAASSFTSVAGF
jgi:uncharacterized protein YukE